MLAKLALLLQSKVALAALGATLVAGTGTVAIVGATQGHVGPVQTPFLHQRTPDSHEGAQNETNTTGQHAHTVSIEGTLTAVRVCASGSTAANFTGIAVTNAKASAEHDASDTEGDESTPSATKAPSASKTPDTHDAKGTPGSSDDSAGGAKTTVTAPVTVALTKDTRVNGSNAKTLGDLCKSIGHSVEVEATKATDGSLTAWKVTVQGGDNGTGNGDNTGDGNNGSNGGTGGTGDHSGSQGQTIDVAGVASAVDLHALTFLLTPATGAPVKVVVNSHTEFEGNAHTLADLHASAHVKVRGTRQSDGSVLATRIEFE